MKQNSIVDYLSCILFRGLSFFTCFLPLSLNFFLGRRLGDLIYFFDHKHHLIANANIRKALGDNFSNLSSRQITRRAYQAFGQNIIEISFIPRINPQYFKKYIHIENPHYIKEAFQKGKGVIFLIVHEGNWELSNLICANMGFPFVLFVRDQGFPRLNALLNSYRLKQGSKIIHKQAGLRQLIETLEANQGIGMTVDQGGKNGLLVKFFGREASMSTGAVKLALKYDCAIIPVFYTRINGPQIKVILDRVFKIERSGDPQKELKDNLQRLTDIYERYLRQYPHEYLWSYKIWKYGLARELVILSDGKTGHLRQSQALAKLMLQQLSQRRIKTTLSTVEINFRSVVARFMFNYLSLGKLRCLRLALTPDCWEKVRNLKPDFIVSSGSSLSEVNYCLAQENRAKSVVLMRPVKLKKFDLVVVPKHDRPAQGKNVVVTQGALNLIDADYLAARSLGLKDSGLIKGLLSDSCIGVLIGGNSKKFSISVDDVQNLVCRIKRAAESLDADILITTSRRTDGQIAQVIKKEFSNYPRCKLLVIANENNHPDVVGGILGLSKTIICSPESISMISEAAESGKYVIVYQGKGLSAKHRDFLNNYRKQGHIYLKEINALTGAIEQIWLQRPKINLPGDNAKVAQALNKIM